MKECPICHKEMHYSFEAQVPLRNVRKCPHCGKLVRKKISIWFIPVVLLLTVSLILFNVHWLFHILTPISVVIFFWFMHKLPYVPYDE